MRKIIISDYAKLKIKNLLEYIENKWSETVRQKFAQKLYGTLRIIKDNPEAFPKSDFNKGVHKCIITKQTTIFYKFNSKSVEIIAIFDTRQNPNQIKKDIK